MEKLFEQIRTEHLNKEEKDSLFQIISEYSKVFHLSSDMLGATDLLNHKYAMKDELPIESKTYTYLITHKKEVRKQLDEMLDKKNN